MSITMFMTSIIGMNMDRMIRPSNLTPTGIGTRAWCTTTRTIRTFIIGTSTPAKGQLPARYGFARPSDHDHGRCRLRSQ